MNLLEWPSSFAGLSADELERRQIASFLTCEVSMPILFEVGYIEWLWIKRTGVRF